MRPSRRLLLLALAALGLSALAIAAGGALREAAPAVWAALALATAADLAISRRPGGDVSAEAPAELFTGQTGALRVAAPAPTGAELRVDWPEGLRGPEEARLTEAPGGGVASLPVSGARRGAWPIRALWLRWPSRFGLIEFTPRIALDLVVSVVPDIRPAQSGRIDVQVRSRLFGIKENAARGDGAEFHQLRDFTAGMDVRGIDWKRSAARRTLVAKEMRAERNHHIILAIDNGHLMREEIEGLPKIDHGVNAALAVAWAAILGGDLVGLFAFDSQPRLFLPPEAGRGAFARLRNRSAGLAYASVETNHTLSLAYLHGRIQRRSLIVVFSDFVDSTTAELLVENVAVLSRRHVIVFVALRDPALARVAHGVPEDLDGVARAVSAGQMARERTLVMERLSRLGVVVIDAEPKALTARLVSTYLDLKSREAL